MAAGPGAAALGLALLLAGGAGVEPKPPVPGTGAGCWRSGGYTYERCCLGNDGSCWQPEKGFTREVCCLAFIEALFQGKEALTSRWAPLQSAMKATPEADPELIACMERAKDGTPYERASASVDRPELSLLCKNSFIHAAECLAQLPGVDVILDLFLGGGCSAAAMGYALGLRRPRSSQERSPELFAFEKEAPRAQYALSSDGKLGMGVEPGWWNVRSESASSALALQTRLTDPQQRQQSTRLPTLWIMLGRAYPNVTNSKRYHWNALDVLCQHRAPLDAVVLDTPNDIEREWMIIEFVCRPRWVLMVNLNIVGQGASWIFHRLSLLPHWTLQLQGHYILGDQHWLGQEEVKRVRAWAVFSRSEAVL